MGWGAKIWKMGATRDCRETARLSKVYKESAKIYNRQSRGSHEQLTLWLIDIFCSPICNNGIQHVESSVIFDKPPDGLSCHDLSMCQVKITWTIQQRTISF